MFLRSIPWELDDDELIVVVSWRLRADVSLQESSPLPRVSKVRGCCKVEAVSGGKNGSNTRAKRPGT